MERGTGFLLGGPAYDTMLRQLRSYFFQRRASTLKSRKSQPITVVVPVDTINNKQQGEYIIEADEG